MATLDQIVDRVMPEGRDVLAKPDEVEVDEVDVVENDQEFSDNLAESMSEEDLEKLSSKLRGLFDDDLRSREDWVKTMVDGLKLLGVKLEDLDDPFEGCCSASFPLMLEAAVQFQARAITELFPANGPVKTKILGMQTPEKYQQAERVREFMNYQLTELMTEYFDELDQLLFALPIVGSCFKKTYFDENRGRAVSCFIKADDFVVPYHATSLSNCSRATHVMRLLDTEVKKYISSGVFREIPDIEAPPASSGEIDGFKQEVDQTEGREKGVTDERRVFLEMHVDEDLPGFEDKTESGKKTGVPLPYVVTIEKETGFVVSIRRNWEESDPLRRRLEWFTHYKYLPGLGFYGFGLVHLLGNLQKSATTILRSLVDAGQYATLPGGFRTRGARVRDGETPVGFGEWREVDGYGDDIKKAFMPLPTKEPSQTLFAMLQLIIDAGRRLASISDINVGDSNTKETPVGTTLAMMENAVKVMSAIHKRLHVAQRNELRILARLNGTNLPDTYPYEVEGATRTIKRADFDRRVDVVPISDPNVFSEAQRQLRAQMQLQIASQFPQIHDLHEAVRRMHEALGTPRIDDILNPEQGPKPMDPATEIYSIMHGKPVMAYPWQDHQAHIMALMAALKDPNVLGSQQAQQMFGPAAMALIADHAAHAYRLEIQQATGIQLEPPPMYDPANPGKDDHYVPLPPQIAQQVAARQASAGQRIAQNAQIAAQAQQNQAMLQDPDTQVKFAKVQVDQFNAQTKRMDVMMSHQGDAQEAQMEQAKGVIDLQEQHALAVLELRVKQLEAQIKQAMAEANMQQDAVRFQQEGARRDAEMAQTMRHREDQHRADMAIKAATAAQKLDLQQRQGEEKIKQAKKTKPQPKAKPE